MKIIPAIDLIEGKCVRLYQGRFDKKTEVGHEPHIQLSIFQQANAEMVHIVDLDGARAGFPVQKELISGLIHKTNLPIEVGGGIRSIEDIEAYLSAGANRIVLGTSAFQNRNLLVEALRLYGERIVVGIDAKEGRVAVSGWEYMTDIDYCDFAVMVEELGARTIIFTDISKDGTMSGPNMDQLRKLRSAVGCTIVASGGIRTMDDIHLIAALGIEEAIVGKAVYEGTIRIGEAEQC